MKFYIHGLDAWSNSFVVGPFDSIDDARGYEANMIPKNFDTQVVDEAEHNKNFAEFGPVAITAPKEPAQ